MNKYLYFSVFAMTVGSIDPTVMYAKKMVKRMNVLFVMADDLRPEMGCYGVNEIHTPNFDRFASQSMVFLNAYCNAPVSGASRASLLTGMYPNYPSRFVNYTCRACVDAQEAIPLSGWLTTHGYYTVSNGKIMHHIDDHADSWSEKPWRYHPDGYDVYWAQYNKWELWLNSESGKFINPKTMRGPFYESADVPDSAYDDGHVLKKTIQDLKRLKDSQKPFFLACGFWKPHLPFCAPKKYWDLYPSLPMATNRFRPSNLPEEVQNSNEIYAYARVSSPDNEEFLRQVKTGYYACVSYIDNLFGVLMDTLDELGLSENTIVILLGDHGWDLGEHQFVGKHNLFNITTRVPLIVRVPGLKAGRSYSMVELVDVYPSLCELCGVGVPDKQLDGKSFVPILKNPLKKVKGNVYVQWQGGDDLLNTQFNFAWWGNSSHMMLFDHQIDPQENSNRSGESKYSSLKCKLFKRLKKVKKYAFRKH